jgi:predicted RNA-binding Zn-ribbon protein involved in translation (DUF1610 family)
MGFAVEQECPQCGGAIALDEADRLFRCPYCAVSSFVSNTEPFRFILPTRKGQDEPPLYVPFIRFRGAVYTCHGLEVDHRLLDVTYPGIPHPLLPVSLGFRPQVMKMKFASPEVPGDFIQCRLSLDEALARIEGNPLRTLQDRVYHRAHIGESFSYIYLPTARRGSVLHDLVTDSILGTMLGQEEMLAPYSRPDWRPIFLPTLCPGCGWNLAGDKDSVVLFCPNCASAWEPGLAGFQEIPFETIFADVSPKNQLLLPFWCISATGDSLQSFADFMRLTNQPKIIPPEWGHKPLTFISPAFKVRPKTYLRLSSQMTMFQNFMVGAAKTMAKVPYPVNMPKSEALESLKIILAATAVAKKNVMPLLPDIHFQTHGITLILLPFQDNGSSLYQEKVGINVSRRDLGFGRSL